MRVSTDKQGCIYFCANKYYVGRTVKNKCKHRMKKICSAKK